MVSFKKVAVIGASGGSGQSTVNALLERGYTVTALSRSASKTFTLPGKTIDGSALDESKLREAISGQDAVIITLGITENPISVRLFGSRQTPLNIRSEGTRKCIEVMQSLGVKRLIVQTTFGSGPSKDKLRLFDRLFFKWILKPQVDDTELQDNFVRQSNLDWTIIQPVHLSDNNEMQEKLFASPDNEVKKWSVSRANVGLFNAASVNDNSTVRKTFSLSTC